MEAQSYLGPIAVTVAYFALWYYLLLIRQRGTKYRLQREYQASGKEFDRYFGQDEEMLAADRAVINTQEQMVPFLSALWLHALFVSVPGATWLGAAYVGLRSFYPLLLGRKVSKIQSKRVYLVTLPCYTIVFYLLGSTVWRAFN
jgi:hypothetical protein